MWVAVGLVAWPGAVGERCWVRLEHSALLPVQCARRLARTGPGSWDMRCKHAYPGLPKRTHGHLRGHCVVCLLPYPAHLHTAWVQAPSNCALVRTACARCTSGWRCSLVVGEGRLPGTLPLSTVFSTRWGTPVARIRWTNARQRAILKLQREGTAGGLGHSTAACMWLALLGATDSERG